MNDKLLNLINFCMGLDLIDKSAKPVSKDEYNTTLPLFHKNICVQKSTNCEKEVKS